MTEVSKLFIVTSVSVVDVTLTGLSGVEPTGVSLEEVMKYFNTQSRTEAIVGVEVKVHVEVKMAKPLLSFDLTFHRLKIYSFKLVHTHKLLISVTAIAHQTRFIQTIF